MTEQKELIGSQELPGYIPQIIQWKPVSKDI